MNTIKEKILDKVRDLNAKKDLSVANFLTPSNEELHDTSVKSRILPMSLGGIGMLGSMLATSHILKKMNRRPIPKKLMIGSTLASAMYGYLYPDLNNAVIRYKHGEISRKAAEKIIKDVNSTASNVKNKTIDIANSSTWGMKKQANIGKVVSGGIGMLGKGLKTFGRAAWSGLKPTPKNAKLGEKIFGYTTKGFALAGVGVGGSVAAKNITAPRSSGNYQTFLRNNILAGNINPNEVPESDAKTVNELGMR